MARVLALVGSAVDDFHAELSKVYARGFLDAMTFDRDHSVSVALVSPDGTWRFPLGTGSASIGGDAIGAAEPMGASDALALVRAHEIDVMVPQMFCRPGMTTYRAAFDLIGVPYLGNTPEVMAMTADKRVARAVVSAAGVAVPQGRVVRAADGSQQTFPVVVKPVDADNSVGVSVVRDRQGLADAIDDALSHSKAALIEQYIPLGREVRCGIVERDGELVCLPLEEYAVDEATRPIRRRADKLDRSGSGSLYLVAKDEANAWIVDTDDPITEAVWAAARACYDALGCRHYGLFDFRIDPQGNPWFLEAGLYCSYSPSSVVAVMAAAAGISVQELFAMSLRESSLELIHR